MHRCHMAANFGGFVDEYHRKLLTLYWLIALISLKDPISHALSFIANSSSCIVLLSWL